MAQMKRKRGRNGVIDETPILEPAMSSASSSFDHDESDHTRNSGHNEKALEPSSTETVEQDFESVMGKLDQFSSTKDKEKIRFVAAFILPALCDRYCQDSPSEIYKRLQSHFNCHEGEALAVFGKILERSCLKIEEQYVKAVISHCPAKVSLPPELLDELSSRNKLLEDCADLEENSKLFQKFLGQFKDEDLGMSKDDIKSYVLLLLRLSVKPEALSKVRSQLAEAQHQLSKEPSVQGPLAILEQKGGKASNKSVSSAPQGVTTGLARDSAEEGTSQGSAGQSNCCSKKSCVLISLLAVLMLLGCLGIFTWLSVNTGRLSGQNRYQNITLYRTTTVLLTKQPLNDQYYTRIEIELEFPAVNRPNVSLCNFDCTQSQPHVCTDQVPLSFTSPTQSTANRRLVRLRKPIQEQLTLNNVFMLEGSSIVFRAAKSNLTHPIELHMVTSNDSTFSNCYNFLHERLNSSYRHFELNESNAYTATFTVPRGMPGTFYCGVIVAPPSAVVNYTVDTQIKVYDIKFYQQMEGVCLNPILGSESSPVSHVISMAPSLVERYTCLLLAQQNDNSYVEAEVKMFATLSNPVFGLFLALACIIFISIIIMLFVLCTVCYLFCQRLVQSKHLSSGVCFWLVADSA